MDTMKDLLDRLQKAVAALANTTQSADDAGDESTEMTPDEFVAYVTTQVEKAATDTPEIRAERLAALGAQIELAKNFEGPTPGKMAVATFKDPGQQTPTMAAGAMPPQNATPGTSATAGPAVQPAGSPTTPAGGELPSQANPPAAATFAKALDDLKGAIEGLAKPTEETTAPVTKTDDGKPAPVTKTKDADKGPIWPMDMNTPWGRGETEDDATPEWGVDPRPAE